MITDAFEPFDLQQFEYAFLLERTATGAPAFKLNIPKVMPLIGKAAPASVRKVFNNNIFVNAADCKPITNNNVTTQNFLTVKRFANTNFSHKDNYGYIDSNTSFIVSFMNKNIRDVKLTDNL